jgi:hypothetical protein
MKEKYSSQPNLPVALNIGKETGKYALRNAIRRAVPKESRDVMGLPNLQDDGVEPKGESAIRVRLPCRYQT